MRKILLSFLTATLLIACSEEQLPEVYSESNIIGLASGARLNHERTEIFLGDFFTDPSIIEDVKIPGYPKDKYHLAGDKVLIDPVNDMDAVIGMDVTAAGITETIPIFKSDKQQITFSFDAGAAEYNQVSARGEFNGWTEGRPAFTEDDGIWNASMMLSPGSYQYLINVDGEDILDPSNPKKVDNNMGGFNSLLLVGEGIAEKVPFIFTVEYGKKDISLGFEKDIDGLFVCWQNKRLPEAYYSLNSTGEIRLNIPESAKNLDRSYIRVWAWNDYGVSNDLLIPLEKGKVLSDPSDLSRQDHHSMIIYNAFVDRFFDADPSNNRPLDIPEVLPPADYHGGDIKGVSQKIKDGYFKALGVNTIWISPLVKNPEGPYGFWPEPASKFSGYHGYWPVSFTLIDDRYGTEEDLHEMVTIAHENNMNVLLDIVANHVHEEHPVYKANPDWATDLYLPDGSLNTERWDEYRLTTWFDVFLPTLDLSKPEVYEMLTDSALFWIQKYDLDGFRHDATKHIPEVFWRALTAKLKQEVILKEGKSIYQIGETYGGPELISSYVGSGMLDAQFDFNVYDDALAVLIKTDEPFSRLEGSLKESLKFYGSHNLMGYITGNQDRGRFTSYAGGGLKFDEDAKLAGWTRKVKIGDKSGYALTRMLFAFNMTIPGLPVIYYGDEIGMPGGNDPDSRRMMRFTELNEDEMAVHETVKKLTHLRQDMLPLVYGDFQTLLITDQTWAYCRTYFDEIVIVVMNKGDKTKNLTFELPKRFADMNVESVFGSMPGTRNGLLSVTLGERSFDLLIKK